MGNGLREERLRLLALLFVAVLSLTEPAHAADELGQGRPCIACHDSTWGGSPHLGYTTVTAKCDKCHEVHGAQAGVLLLQRETVTASCLTCHDGTGGGGVYGAIAKRGLAVGASHRVEATRTIPGGDALTGGPATGSFSGVSGTLSCADCHNPHDGDTIEAFTGDRRRSVFWTGTYSSKLLRRRPTGATTSTPVYGSDWCAACHKGRLSGGPAHNHPVDSYRVSPTPYYYWRLPMVASTTSTSTPVGGSGTGMGVSNFGYVMPWPRSPQQQGHAPICQQCHEDSRDVGIPGAAIPFNVTESDGTSSTDNPRFQNFPHETVNTRMLVEPGDDLCTNCHPPSGLP